MNKSELRNDKIDNILSDAENDSNIIWTELQQGILATTHIPNIREFGKDRTIAYISTDYFGGSGDQKAKLFINNKNEYDKSSEFDWSERPINTVLKKMGIETKDGMDEFDTIGLNNYRSNQDFK